MNDYIVKEFYDTTEYSERGLPYESKSTDKLLKFLNTEDKLKVIKIFPANVGVVGKKCIVGVFKRRNKRK